MVDRGSDRPLYRQIADVLRAQIVTGELQPGMRLLSESALQERYHVDRATVRRALDVLRSESRIVSRRGSGSYVAARPKLRRMTYDLSPGRVGRGFYAAVADEGGEPDVRTTIGLVHCPARMAQWLGVGPGTPVLARSRVMGMAGELPLQLATSYLPQEVVEAVPQLASIDTGPGGMLARLEEAGYGPLHADEIVSARAPSDDERRQLGLGPGVPALVVVRITYAADGTVLDAMDRVIAADRCELAFRIGLSGTG